MPECGDVPVDIEKLKMKIPNPGEALRAAFSLIQVTHEIIKEAVENGLLSFMQCERYCASMEALEEKCGCEGLRSDIFLDEYVDRWEPDDP